MGYCSTIVPKGLEGTFCIDPTIITRFIQDVRELDFYEFVIKIESKGEFVGGTRRKNPISALLPGFDGVGFIFSSDILSFF